MKITKIGHCCLVIETKDVRLLTDPGNWSDGQENERDLDAILVTHEHADHFHIDSIKEILTHNTHTRIITNSSVGALLQKEGIAFEVVGDGDTTEVNGVVIEGHGSAHALIKDFAPIDVENTGYFIDERLYYPGDAFHTIDKPVDILALPVAGPWLKVEEAIAFAKHIQPNYAFPVHDGLVIPGRYSGSHAVPLDQLPKFGIDFIALQNGESVTY